MTNVEPTVVCWDWDTPYDLEWETSLGADDSVVCQVGLLVVMDSPTIGNPIPEENKKIFNIEELVRNEKHIGVFLLESRTSIIIMTGWHKTRHHLFKNSDRIFNPSICDEKYTKILIPQQSLVTEMLLTKTN